ncbi:hypothetical protein NQZ68_010345 [Dissostichus eleginoides]|nr:hypothetical protein NQZ68_010345 [Dissostichus eleginoides]
MQRGKEEWKEEKRMGEERREAGRGGSEGGRGGRIGDRSTDSVTFLSSRFIVARGPETGPEPRPNYSHLQHSCAANTGIHRHQSQDLSGYYSLPPGGVGQISPSMGWPLLLGFTVHAALPPPGARGGMQWRKGGSVCGDNDDRPTVAVSPPLLCCGRQSQPVYPSLPPCGFRQPYSSNLSSASSYSRYRSLLGGPSQMQPRKFPHSLMLGPSGMHPTGIPHPAIVPPSGKQEHDHYDRSMYMKPQVEAKREKEPKKPVIKKPLNAFMLYMKEMRAKVIAECTLKESAAINQILGRRWHALTREEQAKYYELARKERQLHMQLYPTWSARDNYRVEEADVEAQAVDLCTHILHLPQYEASLHHHRTCLSNSDVYLNTHFTISLEIVENEGKYGKKKRRKREKLQDSNTDPGSPKKCRARFGLNQQTDWCGPCRRSPSPPPPPRLVSAGFTVGEGSFSAESGSAARSVFPAVTRKKKCIRYLQGGGCPSPTSSDLSAIDSPPSLSPSPTRHRLYQQHQLPPSPGCSPPPPPPGSPSTHLPLSPPTHTRSHTRLSPLQTASKRGDPRQPKHSYTHTSTHTYTHLDLSGRPSQGATATLSVAKAAGLSLKVLTESQ